jgi:hypothetical protein
MAYWKGKGRKKERKKKDEFKNCAAHQQCRFPRSYQQFLSCDVN